MDFFHKFILSRTYASEISCLSRQNIRPVGVTLQQSNHNRLCLGAKRHHTVQDNLGSKLTTTQSAGTHHKYLGFHYLQKVFSHEHLFM
jgi:hypothetical protein